MAECDPSESMPGRCVDNFAELADNMSKLHAQNMHMLEGLGKIDEHIQRLYKRHDQHTEQLAGHSTAIARLQNGARGSAAAWALWGTRAWRIFIGATLLIIAWYLKSKV